MTDEGYFAGSALSSPNPFRHPNVGPRATLEPEPEAEAGPVASSAPLRKPSVTDGGYFAAHFCALDTSRSGSIPTAAAVSFMQSSPQLPRMGHRDLNRVWGRVCPEDAACVSEQEFVAMGHLMLRHAVPPAAELRMAPVAIAAAVESAGGGAGGVLAADAISFLKRSRLPSGTLNQLWKAGGASAAGDTLPLHVFQVHPRAMH